MVLGRALDCLPPGWKRRRSPIVDQVYSLVVGGDDGASRPRRFHIVYAGAARVARTLDLGEALAALESDLKIHVAEKARGPVFVHASPCERYDDTALPADFRPLPLLFEAYGEGGMLLGQERVRDEPPEELLERLFAATDASYVHIRNAEAGCFMARVDRLGQ